MRGLQYSTGPPVKAFYLANARGGGPATLV
jgi:hypothetical protein